MGYRARFDEAEFRGTYLAKSELARATFVAALIDRVDWSRAELGRADFSRARLSDVNFEFSNLARAHFSEAKLSAVDFKGAWTFLTRFEDVDLGRVVNLTQDQLDIACGNDKTRLPAGLARPESWPCKE